MIFDFITCQPSDGKETLIRRQSIVEVTFIFAFFIYQDMKEIISGWSCLAK